MKLIHTFGALLLSLTAMNAQAEWSKSYAIEYSLGEGDSRVSARQAAIEEIRMKASGEAGTYVEGTTTLHASGQITEQVKVLSASMIKITDVRDKLSINKAGQAVLQVSAKANLDDKELSRRIEALRQDRDKDLKLKQLSAENDELFKALKQIRLEMASKSDSVVIGQLLARQESTIQKLTDNNRQAGQIFESGTLTRMMEENKKSMEMIEQEFDREFYEYLTKGKINAELQTVELVNQSPDMYARAWVNVSWNLDEDYLKGVLSRYLSISRRDNMVEIPAWSNSAQNQRGSVLKQSMYHYLTKKLVNVKVTLGGKTIFVRVLGSCTGDGPEYVQPRYFEHEGSVCIKAYMNGTFPIWLTRSQADNATSFSASMEYAIAPEPVKPTQTKHPLSFGYK